MELVLWPEEKCKDKNKKTGLTRPLKPVQKVLRLSSLIYGFRIPIDSLFGSKSAGETLDPSWPPKVP